MKKSLPLFRKWDIAFLLALLLLALLLLFVGRNTKAPDTVLVLYEGELLEEVSLPDVPFEKTYALRDGSVTVAFYPDGAAILASECPRKTCVEGEKITRGGSGSHCLPLRFSIVLSGEGGLDGVTG